MTTLYKVASRLYSPLLILVFFGILFFDIVGYFKLYVGSFGSYLWFLSYLLFFGFIIHRFVYYLKKLLNGHYILSFIILISVLIIISLQIINPSNVHHETTQQVGCALEQFSTREDKGYFQTCFLGYPTRQYYLSMIPSLLFGTSHMSLQLGPSLYFIFGLILFMTGIVSYVNKKDADYYLALVLVSLPNFYFINHALFNFEQSIYPVSLAFMLAGLFLHYIASPSIKLIFLCGLLLQYILYSYTPSLTLFFLFLGSGFFLLHKSRLKYNLALAAVAVVTTIQYIISLTVRTDLQIVSDSRNYSQLLNDVAEGISHILIGGFGESFATPAYGFIFGFIIFLSLTFYFGKKVFALGLWVVSVIIFSIVSQGYSYYSIEMRLQRVLIIIPVIFTFMILFFETRVKTKHHRPLIYLMIYLFMTGLLFQHQYLDKKENNKNFHLIQWLKNEIDTANKDLVFEMTVKEDYLSIKDYTMYFMPTSDIHTYEAESCETIEEVIKNNAILLTYNKRDEKSCIEIYYEIVSEKEYKSQNNSILYVYVLKKI